MPKFIYQFMKKVIPYSVKKFLKAVIFKYKISHLVQVEIRKMRKYAFDMNLKNDIHNLFARLTYHTHAIEKKLSNPYFREGFGQKAIKNLKDAMIEYKNAGYALDEERFLSAFIVLQEYCKVHDGKPKYTLDIYKFLDSFSITPPVLKVGAIEYQKKTIIKKSKSMFSDLALNRISVRDYSQAEVDDSIILNSIGIAIKSPSVCNRQPWRVHLIKNEELLMKILNLHGGFRGNGDNLKKIILVTVDLRYFSNAYERNQGYIDGGIFLISLVYALTCNEIATCILNAMFDIKRENEMRSLLNLEDSEILIGFITIGNYPDKFKSPASLRISPDKCLTIH